MFHYAFNVGDYRKDTAHLSLLEHGIYRNLLDSYYMNEGPLEADDTKLMRTHCVRSADEQQAYKNVIADFFIAEDGYYRHRGCDKVLAAIYEKSDKARKSAEARWSSKNKPSRKNSCEPDANALPSQSERNANGMLPITHNPIPKDNSDELSHSVHENKPSGAESQFNLILSAYPKRAGSNPRKAALSAFKARLAEGVDPDDIAAGVDRYFRYCTARGSIGTEFVMQASRFMGPGKEFENDWEIGNANHNGKNPQHGLQHGSGSGKLSTVGRNNLAAERYLENLHREASEASGDHGAIVAEAG